MLFHKAPIFTNKIQQAGQTLKLTGKCTYVHWQYRPLSVEMKSYNSIRTTSCAGSALVNCPKLPFISRV